jgi:hypothetical protein
MGCVLAGNRSPTGTAVSRGRTFFSRFRVPDNFPVNARYTKSAGRSLTRVSLTAYSAWSSVRSVQIPTYSSSCLFRVTLTWTTSDCLVNWRLCLYSQRLMRTARSVVCYANAPDSYQPMELLEAVTDLPVWEPMVVPRKRYPCDDSHPELPYIRTAREVFDYGAHP